MLNKNQRAKIEKLLINDLEDELNLNTLFSMEECEYIAQYWGEEMLDIRDDTIPFFNEEGEWDIQGIERMFNKHSEPLGDEFVSAKILCKDKNSYITIED